MKRTEEWKAFQTELQTVKYEGPSAAYERWKKEEKQRKQRGIIIAFVLLMVGAFFLVPIPVSYTCDAVEFQVNNPSYQESCTLTVKGTYQVNLFSDSEFRGKVILSGHPAEDIMKEYETKLVFDKKHGANFEYNAREDEKEEWLWCPVGRIAQSGLMRKFCITIALDQNGEKVSDWMNSSSWNSRDGYFAVTGTKDYEKAIEILTEYGFVQE